ncbi:MAG: alkaline phosphatase family protein, partial [bacterium]
AKAEHGTMQPESRRVPILFVVPGIPAHADARAIRTVDIGPTIAALLGIQPTERIDGTPIDLAVKR